MKPVQKWMMKAHTIIINAEDSLENSLFEPFKIITLNLSNSAINLLIGNFIVDKKSIIN